MSSILTYDHIEYDVDNSAEQYPCIPHFWRGTERTGDKQLIDAVNQSNIKLPSGVTSNGDYSVDIPTGPAKVITKALADLAGSDFVIGFLGSVANTSGILNLGAIAGETAVFAGSGNFASNTKLVGDTGAGQFGTLANANLKGNYIISAANGNTNMYEDGTAKTPVVTATAVGDVTLDALALMNGVTKFHAMIILKFTAGNMPSFAQMEHVMAWHFAKWAEGVKAPCPYLIGLS